MKRLISVLLVAMMVCGFVGCSKGANTGVTGGTVDFAVNEIGNTVDDSSDLPDWTGKKLSLRMWFGAGNGNVRRNLIPTEGVVNEELYRVTGVKFDEDTSFDNGGESFDAKVAKNIASNDWPDVLVQVEDPRFVEEGLVYDLTDLIPKYCPNIVALANKTGVDYLDYFRDKNTGRIYKVPIQSMNFSYNMPDLNKEDLILVEPPVDPIGYVYVRDDVLKMLYPNAKSQTEIEELYMKNGGFSMEEILDVPINSKEDFFKFLYDIKKLGLKDGNTEIYPTFIADGLDNWALLSNLGFLYGYNINNGYDANYFTYWDKETNQIEYMFKQDFFKEMLRDYTKLVQDGIASPESLVDTRSVFEQKVNNGHYAVIYGATSVPNLETLNAQNEGFKYRKVYINVPFNNEKFVYTTSPNIWGESMMIMNNGRIKEEDLPQILRFVDFVFSEAGQKLTHWGPRSAGLWTEEDGKRTFIDKELEAKILYGAANEKDVYYGLQNGVNNSSWPGSPVMGASRYNPKIMYEIERTPSLASKFFSVGMHQDGNALKSGVSYCPNVWYFTNYVKGAKTFWDARQEYEDSIKKVFTAKDNKEFEKLYKDLVFFAETNGLTDKTLTEINTFYADVYNVNYMDNIKK